MTGRLPFGEPAPGDALLTIIFTYIQEPLLPPQQFMSDLPPRLVQVIIKALKKNSAHWFQSALENIIPQLPMHEGA